MEAHAYQTKLGRLSYYLRQLPATLPIIINSSESRSRYDFTNFAPDPEWIEDAGLNGAVNRELEVRLGTRANGPIHFIERGPAVKALVSVLEKYTRAFPNNLLLQTWVDDALKGAENTFAKANLPVSLPNANDPQ